jgi:translation elongation factor aEF-1 beta
MTQVIITMKIMPSSPEVNLQDLADTSSKIIEKHEGFPGKVDFIPLAFGLQSVNIIFTRDEAKGSMDNMEEELADLENVSSAEIVDVRRAVG